MALLFTSARPGAIGEPLWTRIERDIGAAWKSTILGLAAAMIGAVAGSASALATSGGAQALWGIIGGVGAILVVYGAVAVVHICAARGRQLRDAHALIIEMQNRDRAAQLAYRQEQVQRLGVLHKALIGLENDVQAIWKESAAVGWEPDRHWLGSYRVHSDLTVLGNAPEMLGCYQALRHFDRAVQRTMAVYMQRRDALAEADGDQKSPLYLGAVERVEGQRLILQDACADAVNQIGEVLPKVSERLLATGDFVD